MREVSFHQVANYYDWLAKLVFGKAIQQSQLHYLDSIPLGSRVLLIGGGTGWILENLLLSGLCSHITFVETAPAMIHKAQKVYQRCKEDSATVVEFVLGSAAAMSSNETYDVLITFFVIDVYSTPDAAKFVNILNRHLKKAGLWLFADFDPYQKPPPLWQTLMLRLMYYFFRLTTNLENQDLPDFKSIFSASNLQSKSSKYFFHSFIRSTIYQKI